MKKIHPMPPLNLPKKPPQPKTRYRIVCVLDDGQEFDDEAHVGPYDGKALTYHEANRALCHLEDTKHDVGHHDVRYRKEEIREE